MKCKYFKKETGDKYCSNYLGPQIVGAYGEGTIIKHNCKDKTGIKSPLPFLAQKRYPHTQGKKDKFLRMCQPGKCRTAGGNKYRQLTSRIQKTTGNLFAVHAVIPAFTKSFFRIFLPNRPPSNPPTKAKAISTRTIQLGVSLSSVAIYSSP